MTATATQQTFEILGQEFDLDQLNDIASHGMAQGVSGFIYSTELANIFDQHEESIFNYLDELAFELGEKSGIQMCIDAITRDGDDAFYTMQEIKEMAVWMYVESVARDLLIRNAHQDWV